MSWRVFCEGVKCRWHEEHVESRDVAVAAGRAHILLAHDNDEEWQFRVQGVRAPDSAEEAFVTLRDAVGNDYRAHCWVPDERRRDRNLPCGVCGIYRDVHRWAAPLLHVGGA